MGGLVAHGVAVSLQAAGERGALPAMLDSSPGQPRKEQPRAEQGPEPGPEPRLFGRPASLRDLLTMPGRDLPPGTGTQPLTDERFAELVRRVPDLPDLPEMTGSLDDAELAAPVEVTAANRRLFTEFAPPSTYRGDLLFFTAAQDPDARRTCRAPGSRTSKAASTTTTYPAPTAR